MNKLRKARTRLTSDRWLLETASGLASLTAATLGVLAYAWLLELRIEVLDFLAAWVLLAIGFISLMLILRRQTPLLRLGIWPFIVALGLLFAPWLDGTYPKLVRQLGFMPTHNVSAESHFVGVLIVIAMAAAAIGFLVQLLLLSIHFSTDEHDEDHGRGVSAKADSEI